MWSCHTTHSQNYLDFFPDPYAIWVCMAVVLPECGGQQLNVELSNIAVKLLHKITSLQQYPEKRAQKRCIHVGQGLYTAPEAGYDDNACAHAVFVLLAVPCHCSQ
jgi:hypothetical protein